MAEQGEAGVYRSSRIRAALQHTAHLVLRLVEMNAMAELSPGANVTGLASLLCIYGPIAEIASFCSARNFGGAAATCFVAMLAAAAAACPLSCPGLQDAEDPAFFPTRAASAAWGGSRAKISSYPRRSGYQTGEQEWWKNPCSLPCFSYSDTKLSPNLRFAART